MFFSYLEAYLLMIILEQKGSAKVLENTPAIRNKGFIYQYKRHRWRAGGSDLNYSDTVSSLCKQFLFPLLPSFVFLPILSFLPNPVTPPFSASQETSQNFYFFFSRQIGIFWIIFPLADLSSYFVLLTICIIK